MKRMFFLFAFLFAIVAMEANVVPIDNDVGPPITMELNTIAEVAVAQNVDFLFVSTWQVDKVIKIETEYVLSETSLSSNVAVEVTEDGIFINTYQIKRTKRKDQNSNYFKSYLRDNNINRLVNIAALDQNNTYFKSYLRQMS